MQRRQCCKGARKRSCKRRKEAAMEASSERTPLPAIPVPEPQDWKLPTWVRARNTFKEISQGSGGLSKYVSDVCPTCLRQVTRALPFKAQGKAAGKMVTPYAAVCSRRHWEEGTCLPQPCKISSASPGSVHPPCCLEPVNAKGLWKRADPFSLNLGVIYRLCCWEPSVKANFGKPGLGG